MEPLEIIEDLPISKGISFQQLERISKYCLILEYETDEFIYSKETPFNYIGMIISGKVEYFYTDPLSNKTVHLGSFIKYPVGLFNFMPTKEKDVHIKAVQKTQILAINFARLHELEEHFPFFTNRLYRTIISLQMSITKRILNVITKRGMGH